MFDKKIIFITGGTGTWGKAIINNLLKNYNVEKIIVFSRSEDRQVHMERELNNIKINFVLGDIRNINLLRKVTRGVDYIIHLAALKHILKCEQNTQEAIEININGTQNIIDVSVENDVQKVLYVSTDKAVEPHNIYGNTKSISEKLITSANTIQDSSTIFYTIRAGNILGSNGSIVRIFYEQIINKHPITVTDFNMKRFYVTTDYIVELILYSFEKAKGGEIFIGGGIILSVKEILDIMLELYGNGDEKVLQNGMKQGEKMNETLISNNEAGITQILNNKYFIIDNLGRHQTDIAKVDFDEYSTAGKTTTNSITIKESITKMYQ